jgi:putative N6-adenine-specific DNA methylase
MRLFAACLPGLEDLLADELASLTGAAPERVKGGALVEGDDRALYQIALGSRLASRLSLRVGTFGARRFEALVKKTRSLPWGNVLPAGARVKVRARCNKSRLHHSGAVEERVLRGIAGARGEEHGDGPELSIACRIVHDEVTLSVDLTGEPLYKRGYRQATAKAPLREDLACALLVLSGWRADTPLLDPFCGSGTIVVEGARMARGMLPGGTRRFAFEKMPFFDDARLSATREALERRFAEGRAPAPIHGGDRDAGAIASAKDNAERAGVADAITFHQAPLGKAPFLRSVETVGALVTNPPHGKRVGDPKTLRRLYQSLGARIAELPAGHLVALLVRDPRAARAVGVPLETRLTTDQGGGKVRVLVGHA